MGSITSLFWTNENHTDNDVYIMTAAIDFGTSYSGYGYSFRNTIINDIFVNKDWGAEAGMQMHKAPTSVLVNSKGKFVSFGFEAENQYSELTQEELPNYDLFRHFKMMLYHEKNLTRSTTIKSTTGRRVGALNIFAMCLHYLKAHLIETVSRQVAQPPDNKMIKWVLTIPAIWNDKAKQFMREAALEAGLITSVNSKQLILALEPEAASLLCRTLEVNHFTKTPFDMMETSFHAGTKYMVIDAGGGTIDITVHEILEDGNIKELIPATGGNWGGNEVNKQFEDLLQNIFGEEFITTFKVNHVIDWLKLQNDFEKKKRPLLSEKGKMHINLPYGIDRIYQNIMHGDIEEVINNAAPDFGVCFAQGYIVLDQNTVYKLYESVLTKIIDKVNNILDAADIGNLQYIVLVGGFGESKLLYNRLNEEFKHLTTVISPVFAGLTIIKGAVLFGYNPSVISTRKARKTYGYNIAKAFIEGVHDKRRTYRTDRGIQCLGCFETFLQKNESVDLNSVKSFRVWPIYKSSTSTHFNIYNTDSMDIMYSDDPRLQKIGEIRLEFPSVPHNKIDNRRFEIQVRFGGTEIEVEVCTINKNGTETKSLSIDYFTD